MRNIFLFLLALLFSQAAHAMGEVVEREFFVPDDKTAISIAKAILIPIFGKNFDEHHKRQTFSKTHNFYATSYQDMWVVEDAPPARLAWAPPILRVEIDKKRSCIQKVSEYERVERKAFVPDEATAIAIAKAVLIPIFGETFEEHRKRQTFSKAHNFYATSYQDMWVVEDAPPARLKWSEPILRVEIDKKRGCVLNVSEY